uniref:Chordin n=1 Tax=Lepisosteus oculatus TaxID=7918 RepID=W5MQW8_LEPOC
MVLPGSPLHAAVAAGMRTCWSVVVLCLLSCAWLESARASRLKSPALPIQSEREPLPSKGIAGCSFGGRFYELEDTWHPDLGEPFGVMHCVICYCEPQRNRRKVFGKVTCKNIKQDCPEPNCDEPVLLPGNCCRTCPKVKPEKKVVDMIFDGYEYYQEKDDDLQKTYNDRSYLSSEDVSPGESRTDFVALLTSTVSSRSPISSGVARARFTLSRTSLVFSITFERVARPSKVHFLDGDGNVVFEFRVPKTASPESNMICGIWKSLSKSYIRLLRSEQLHVTMVTLNSQREEIQGKIIKHRALFAAIPETFSSTLTSEAEHSGMGGIAMLTLSDTENNLHFILLFQGLLERREAAHPLVPIRVQLQYRQHVLREIRANVTAHDPDFAEVLTDLNSRELFWLSRGQLEIAVETEGTNTRRISGFISGRKSCDTIQSVLSSGDALTPGKTGAVGSAVFNLHDNGTLDYQVQVVGVSSKVVGVTIETKPRRRSKRNVLYDLSTEYREGRAVGAWSRLEARHIHMLLQNELFINVATLDHQEGELRGQIRSLLYNGLETRRLELPVPLAGQIVSPPVQTSAGGHAWVSVDDQCHLHYEIVVAGLSKSEDVTINVHLHGFAEIGELDDNSSTHKRLLMGFYGSQAQGVLKDLSMELLRHLDRGTAFIQVSTKLNPKGEIRGRVHVPNRCEAGPALDLSDKELEDPLSQQLRRDPEEMKKDPNTCFFEGYYRAHGSRWTPDYNNCFTCSCQKRTVICDPVICPVLTCKQTVQPEDKCCPVCEETRESKDIKSSEKSEEHPEGCYFEGDQKMHAPGTTWHPFVPPFGYIKCAICTCKGATGEVHCEKVTCPPLTCSKPIRRNLSDCCKECPEEAKDSLEHTEMMQADGTRHCKFGKNYYQDSDNWHPHVPLLGEMKCITCWCDHGVTKCQRKQCPVLTCSNIVKRENSCCPECQDANSKEEKAQLTLREKRRSWRY